MKKNHSFAAVDFQDLLNHLFACDTSPAEKREGVQVRVGYYVSTIMCSAFGLPACFYFHASFASAHTCSGRGFFLPSAFMPSCCLVTAQEGREV